MQHRSFLAATLLSATLLGTALPAQMAGTYVLDPNASSSAFHSFTEACNAMFVSGIAGPVEILVMPGTYTESVLVPPLQGASSTNTITFRALAGPGTVLLSGAAGDTFARYRDRLARGLAHILNVLDPEVVVFGGGMSNVSELYEQVPPQMARSVFSDVVTTPLRPARHGDSSGVRGAAWLWLTAE